MKSASQTSQKDTSILFEEECAEEVLLPKKEVNLMAECTLTDEEFMSNLNDCLSISEQKNE